MCQVLPFERSENSTSRMKQNFSLRSKSIFASFLFLMLIIKPGEILAAGELDVRYLGVPLSGPIFSITNSAPGDIVTRIIDVENVSGVPQLVAIKSNRTGGLGIPAIEGILNVVISDGVMVLYGTGSLTGPKTVQDFFDDSTSENGISLGIIGVGVTKNYSITVTFPTSADNEYQNKSVIFDIHIGAVISNTIVINEVYYQVAHGKGLDSPHDRGILGINGNTATIEGNGNNSNNTINVDIKKTCKILQRNYTDINNFVVVAANSGNNSSNGNAEGPNSIVTGIANAIAQISNFGGFNYASCSGNNLGQNHEWIEVYNPTEQTISLKNWTLTDNAGTTKINGNRKLKPHQFGLISKDSSIWRFWNEHSAALKIELGKSIGNGLDNEGDHIILRDQNSTEADFVAWGDDIFRWNPAVPLVPVGSSIERLTSGFDTDDPSDWEEQTPPSPGI